MKIRVPPQIIQKTMKKIIILMMIVLGTFTSRAQDSTKTTISEIERVVDKYGEKIADGFISTMETAKPVAKEGFKVVVKLQFAKGIANLLPLLIFIISVISITKLWGTEHLNNKDISAVGFIWLTLLIISFVLAIFDTYSGITHLIAPEWFAIKEIITLMK